MSILEIQELSRRFHGTAAPAVNAVSFAVERGECLALLGHSGSGKTTLLRLIAGFNAPDSGTIWINGRVMASDRHYVAPEKRGVGMVFQDYAVFPHLRIAENIAFGLDHLARPERARRTAEILAMVGLEGLGARYPHQVSGGQLQRVAIARALAPQPALLLLDEPFSNLDESIKENVRMEVQGIIRQAGSTALFVTHDIDDAFAIADRIAVLKDGTLQQIGKPAELYRRPCNEVVARHFGTINLLAAQKRDGKVHTALGIVPEHVALVRASAVQQLALRPEDFRLGEKGRFAQEALVVKAAFHGARREICVRLESGGDTAFLWLALPADAAPREGDIVSLEPIWEHACLLPSGGETEANITA